MKLSGSAPFDLRKPKDCVTAVRHPFPSEIHIMFGIPLGDLVRWSLRCWRRCVLTGLLAGMFGVGGGAVIVPVLYQIFGFLGVPEDVRMHLCVGTSLAIIIPTSIQSYRAHRAKGKCWRMC